MTLKDLPPDARPREKLLARGPGALSDTELLALLLRTGTAGKGVLQLASDLLSGQGIAGLLQASKEKLVGIKGLGPQAKSLASLPNLPKRSTASPTVLGAWCSKRDGISKVS